MVRRFGVRVMIVRKFPVGRRYITDGIYSFTDVCPVRAVILCSRKEAAYAYDGKLAAGLCFSRFYIVSFHLEVLLQLCVLNRSDFHCFGGELNPLGTEHGSS